MTEQPNPAFAARETALTERETKIRHDDHVSFAEHLVQEGRLLPASKDKVVAILDALPATEAVSFSEGGEKLTPGAALRQVLEAQPGGRQPGSACPARPDPGRRADRFRHGGRGLRYPAVPHRHTRPTGQSHHPDPQERQAP